MTACAPVALTPAAPLAQPDFLDEDSWSFLLENIKDHRCTVFLGPKLALWPHRARGLIARLWAKMARAAHYPFDVVDDLPQFYQFLSQEQSLAWLWSRCVESWNQRDQSRLCLSELDGLRDALSRIRDPRIDLSALDDIASKLAPINHPPVDQSGLDQLRLLDQLRSKLSQLGDLGVELNKIDDLRSELATLDDPGIDLSKIDDLRFEIAELVDLRSELTSLSELSVDLSGRDDPRRVLARLPICTYVTTNIDTCMAKALRLEDKDPRPEICRWKPDLDREKSYLRSPDFQARPGQPVVYHLFGNTDKNNSMVLTEDDHLDFLLRVASDPKVLPDTFVQELKFHYLLFLGYRLRDFDFRILMRSLSKHLKLNSNTSAHNLHVAVPIDDENRRPAPQELARWNKLKQYLGARCRELRIGVSWGKCEDFIRLLGAKYEAYREGP